MAIPMLARKIKGRIQESKNSIMAIVANSTARPT